MGPRSFERGNEALDVVAVQLALTSMGPRSFERGNCSGIMHTRVN